MSPFAIVIHFHAFKSFYFCFFPSLELHSLDQLDFEPIEKTFSNGIVPTIAFLAHAANELVLNQYRLEIIAGIRASPARVTITASGMTYTTGIKEPGPSFIWKDFRIWQ